MKFGSLYTYIEAWPHFFEGKTAAQWFEDAKKLPEIELTKKLCSACEYKKNHPISGIKCPCFFDLTSF